MPSDTVVVMGGTNSQSVTVQLHEVASESSMEGTTEVEDDDEDIEEDDDDENSNKRRFSSLSSKLSHRFGTYMEKAKESRLVRNIAESKYVGRLTKFWLRVKEYWHSPESQKFRAATSSWFLGESARLHEEITELGFWSSMVGEYIGTLLLVVIGCGAASPELARLRHKDRASNMFGENENLTYVPPPRTGLPDDEDRLAFDIYVSIAFGFTYAVALFALHHGNDGHLNPSVSLAMFVTHRQGFFRVTIYIVCQFLGAICGAYCLSSITPAELNSALGSTNLAEDVGWWQGFAVEFVSTFLLVFVVLSCYSAKKTRDKRTSDVIVPFIIGLTVITCSLFACPYTRGSLNTVRSFGPAYVSGMWDNHWVYWFGPLMGGVAGGMSQEVVFGKSALFRRIQSHFLRQYHLSPAVSAYSINTMSSMSCESIPQAGKSSGSRRNHSDSRESGGTRRLNKGRMFQSQDDFRQRTPRNGSDSDTMRKEFDESRQRSSTMDSIRGGKIMPSDMGLKNKAFRIAHLEYEDEDSEDPVYRGSEFSDDDDDDSNRSEDGDVIPTNDDVDDGGDGDDERDDSSKAKRIVTFDLHSVAPVKRAPSYKKSIGTNTRLSLVNIADATTNEETENRNRNEFGHNSFQPLVRESYVSHPPPIAPLQQGGGGGSASYYGATDVTPRSPRHASASQPAQEQRGQTVYQSQGQSTGAVGRGQSQGQSTGAVGRGQSTAALGDTKMTRDRMRSAEHYEHSRDYENVPVRDKSEHMATSSRDAGKEQRSQPLKSQYGEPREGNETKGERAEMSESVEQLSQRKKIANVHGTDSELGEKQDSAKSADKTGQSSKTTTPLKSALKKDGDRKASESTSSPGESRKGSKNQAPVSILKKTPEKDPNEVKDELRAIGDNLASAWLKSEASSRENLTGEKPSIPGLEIKSVESDLEKQRNRKETDISEPFTTEELTGSPKRRRPSPTRIETYDRSPPYAGPSGPRTLSTSTYGDIKQASPIPARKAVSQEVLPSVFTEYRSTKSPILPRSADPLTPKPEALGPYPLLQGSSGSLQQSTEIGIGEGGGTARPQQKVHSPVVLNPSEVHTMVTSAVMHSAYFSPISSPRAERKVESKQPSPSSIATNLNLNLKKTDVKPAKVSQPKVESKQPGPAALAPKKVQPSPAVSPGFGATPGFFGAGLRGPSEAQEREWMRRAGKPFTGEVDPPEQKATSPDPFQEESKDAPIASRSVMDIIMHPTGKVAVLTTTEDNEVTFVMKEKEEEDKVSEVDVDAIEGRVEDLSEGEYSPLGGMIRSDDDDDSSD